VVWIIDLIISLLTFINTCVFLEAIILTLQEYGLECSDGETGVWLGVERHSLKFVHWGAQIALGNHARAFECKC
jgi:hypothetical protein